MNLPIRAITLWQPWATLIALGYKRVETRSWGTSYRGTLAIHAAARPMNKAGYALLSDLEETYDDVTLGGIFETGAIVAISQVIDCRLMTLEVISAQTPLEIECGLWEPGRFAWKLAGIKKLVSPIKCKGKQGLWVPDEQIRSQLTPQTEKLGAIA